MTYRPMPKRHASPLQALGDERRMSATHAERRLERILNTVNGGVLRGRFSREWVCGKGWIVDFFFPEVRLAIEVDGPYHRTPDQLFRDLDREVEIEKFAVTIIRITNEQVFGDRDKLLNRLREGWRAARASLSAHARPKSPMKAKLPRVPKPTLEVTKSEFYKSTIRSPKPYVGGWTSLKQGERHVGDTVPRRHIDEGIAGSRDANRETRRQQSVDMRNRGRIR